MKWFRKDNSYLWVRSELENSNPTADAMERITRYYRADRHEFEAALCAILPGRARRTSFALSTPCGTQHLTALRRVGSPLQCACRDGGENCVEHRRVVALNKQEAKAMRHYTP